MQNKTALIFLLLINIANAQTFQERANALPKEYLNALMSRCGEMAPNRNKALGEIVSSADEFRMSCLEAEVMPVNIEIATDNIKKQIKKDRKFGNDLGIGFQVLLRTRALTTAKKRQLENKFRTASSLLNMGTIDAAREEIDSLTTDADFTVQDKTDVLSSIDNYLGN